MAQGHSAWHPLPVLFPAALSWVASLDSTPFFLHVPSCPSRSHPARNGRRGSLGRGTGCSQSLPGINGLMPVPDTGKELGDRWFLCGGAGGAVA